jgi:AraC family transcriptional regulator
MTTTLAPSPATGGVMWAPPVAAPSSGWAVPARGNVGALPMSRLRRVTEYIQQNLDKDLPLAELAALISMSPFHFARLFKGSTGLPPHRFVIRQRIARARACLSTPDLSIAQISRSVGFRTPSHFTTVFRRVTGITPRRFRARHRNDRIRPIGG